jgi:hypothetical protein
MISATMDGILSLALGVWVTLIGFGRTSLSKDKVKAEAFMERWGSFFKVAGPLIVLWGLFNIVRGLKG